ncbi:hypothetical protein CDD81_435 [Ophiocordyceps australis]|uniref:CST complex subunit Stn1 N-terminal domain-containing protein n=1 Tax=Ophiocordyceps australis TaxID=1399860 RepID=A0A2C5XY19_9HYPO|nr:hypothetical protein CDD81_435 [Ophiocordyceps australis]
MSEDSRPQSEIYPRYCFHLSPTINTWCLLRACDLSHLEKHDGFQGENFFFFNNLPIKWVRIVGVVVAIDDFAGRRVFTVDDSSGACAQVVITRPSTVAAIKGDESKHVARGLYQDIDVGAIVDVKGSLYMFRDEKHVRVEKMAQLRCTQQEVSLWERRTKFRREVLEKPWILQRRDIRRCRKEVEGSGTAARRHERRVKGRAASVGVSKERSNTGADGARHRGTGGVTRDLVEGMIRGGLTQGKYNALGL